MRALIVASALLLASPASAQTPIYRQTWEGGVGGWYGKEVGVTLASDPAAPSPPTVQVITRETLGGDFYSPHIRVTPGTMICVSGWIKWVSGGWPFIGLDRFALDGNLLGENWLIGEGGSYDVTAVPIVDGWHWYGRTFAVPSDTFALKIKNELWVAASRGGDPLAYFDDLAIHEGACSEGPPSAANTPPSITASPGVNTRAGGRAASTSIASVGDAEDGAAGVVVTATGTPAGITVSNIVNTNGAITATVAAGCTATPGPNHVTLQVVDSAGATATTTLVVNVTANAAPLLGSYGTIFVATGGSATASPSGTPSDDGTFGLAVASQTFTGTLAVNSVTGVVTIANANFGVHTVVVTATDNCGATKTTTFALAVGQPATTGADRFEATGSMSSARLLVATARLADGRVLVAGGHNGAVAVANSDVYDPATGTFTPVGPLSYPRAWATASLLTNGRVLVCGGWDGTAQNRNDCDLFDPMSGTFRIGPSMAVRRATHTATTLADGKVLIAGGYTSGLGELNGVPTAAAEIYDPATNSFTATATTMTRARGQHGTARLLDGRVLLAGGWRADGAADVFDPATRRFTAVSNVMSSGRDSIVAITLPNGKVLITGGYNGSNHSTTADLYDPSTNTFTQTSPPNDYRTSYAAVLLPNGRALLAGSEYGRYTSDYYDYASAAFTPGPRLVVPHYRTQAVLLEDGRVLIPGGHIDGAGTATSAADIYVPRSSQVVASGPVRVGQKSKVTVYLFDVNGNPVPNITVRLSSSGSGNAFADATGLSDAQGRFATTFTSSAAELKTITAAASLLTLSTQLVVDPNTPPAITAGAPLTLVAGNSISSSIASVGDAEDGAAGVVVTATGTPAGITVSNIVNTNGAITATVAAGCTATPGPNHVTLQVVDSAGETATTLFVVNVTVANPTIGPSGPTAFCAGSSVILTASGGVSYRWMKDGSAIANATSSNFVATQTGRYAVVATNAFGCTRLSNEIDVKAYPLPVTPSITTVVGSGNATLTATTSTAGVSYTWKRDGVTLADTTSSIMTSTGGTYTVTVIDPNGCSSTSPPTSVVITRSGQSTYSSEGVTISTTSFPIGTTLSVDTMTDPTAIPPVPTGYYTLVTASGQLAMAYEINSSAKPTSKVDLVFDVPAVYAPDAKTLRSLAIMHWERDPKTGQYMFRNVTTRYEWNANVTPIVRRIYASVTSLSPVVFAYVLGPTIDAIVAPSDPVLVEQSLRLSASFTDPTFADPLAGDVFSATWTWGDGSQTPGSVTPPLQFSDGAETVGVVIGNHSYSAAGVYTVVLSISDGTTRGGSGFVEHRYVVVYDPSGGFVTGGGWILSPVGAYAPNALLTGRATFGFVSKYAKGATVPAGDTHFVFQAADFRFRSSAYEWLVISGARAQYKGRGTVGGIGDYGFLLTAIDGQAPGGGGIDRFRLKVWERSTGTIVYDNEVGATDENDPSTAIAGGSIVIHKP